MPVTDCHVHINPNQQMLPAVRAIFGNSAHRDEVERFQAHPEEFLRYLDRCGVDRAVLVNYVAPEVIGYTESTNEFVSKYATADPRRLIAIGGVSAADPEPGRTVERLVRTLGIRGIKLHPAHQLIAPNSYTDGRTPGLRGLYAACEELAVPLIVHTGTSIFPGARNRFADPMLVEDVAVDFPKLTIVLAHGGRPLWMESAVFLARRFPNVYLEISSVPPTKLLQYFPQLERLAAKSLFGTDWPGPGVPDIGSNLTEFRALPLSDAAQRAMLEENPLKVFRPPS
jgi:predicted TIM-barrel fold metal-dependent hydrolase